MRLSDCHNIEDFRRLAKQRLPWPVFDYIDGAADDEVTKAKRIIEAMEQAQKEGKGAVALDGRLIDIASIKQAEVMVQKAEQIKAAG